MGEPNAKRPPNLGRPKARRALTARVGAATARKRSPRGRPESTDRASSPAPSTRLGNVGAAARLLAQLQKPAKLTSGQQRQLLAALCKLIGYQVSGVDPSAHDSAPPSELALVSRLLTAKLSPRLRQTLQHLLQGDSEKQIARKLKLSPHTIHVYVKALYRRFEVASRGELLARFVQR